MWWRTTTLPTPRRASWMAEIWVRISTQPFALLDHPPQTSDLALDDAEAPEGVLLDLFVEGGGVFNHGSNNTIPPWGILILVPHRTGQAPPLQGIGLSGRTDFAHAVTKFCRGGTRAAPKTRHRDESRMFPTKKNSLYSALQTKIFRKETTT